MKLFKSSELFVILAIFLFSWFALRPLFAPGFFSMHDDTQIARVFVMAEALKDGQFPVRVVDYLGYDFGYAVFNFYAPLAYYIGALLILLGISAVTATKVMIGMGIVLAGIFMYLLAKELWGKIGGLVAGLFYLYAPYHSVNVYVRGAIAELWAYAFIPLAFYGFYKVFTVLSNEKTPSKPKTVQKGREVWKYIALAALGYAGIILSHNLTAMMVTPFIVLLFSVFGFQLFRKKKLYAIRFPLYAFFLGLGISAFYFLPALLEMKYADVGSVLGGGSDFRDHFLCPIQFWYSPWGYGGSVPGCTDGISFQLGKPHILVTLIALLSLPFLYKKKRYFFYVLSLIFLCLAFVLFLMLPSSSFLWEVLSPMEYFQFPWRFLVMAAFFMSLLAGSIVFVLSNMKVGVIKQRSLIMIGMVGSLFLLYLFYTKLFIPQSYTSHPERQTEPQILRYEISQISDEYLPPGISVPKQDEDVPESVITVLQGRATIRDITTQSNRVGATIIVTDEARVLFQKAAFPAWTLYSNGREMPYEVVNGKIEVELPKGDHFVQLIFVQTPLEKAANSISVISLLALVTGIIRSRKQSYRE